ncbi:MAG: hypothetical protein K0B10_07840 [Vicingaceae bacterium]|nr:hypothetical protein [Vicingaceae bacterium]
MAKNIYLNKAKKKKYMKDFDLLLNCKQDFWQLDFGVNDFLIKVNLNQNIQTLYSKKHNLNDFNCKLSYLKFCYFKEIELLLFRFVLPELILKYNNQKKREDTSLYYIFSFPKTNDNCTNNSNQIGIGCADNNDYFNINHLTIYLNSPYIEVHNEFWNDLVDKLSILKS